MAIEISEELLTAIATKEKTLADGRALVQKGAFSHTHRTADAALIWGECQGSTLYALSIDLAGDHPVGRCTCPSRPPPCKHTLGLMALFLLRPECFDVAEAPVAVVEKREKSAQRAKKRAEAIARPDARSLAAIDKKTAIQRHALDLLETILLDVVTQGLTTIDAQRAQRLVEAARQMTDAYLPGAAVALRRLAALAVRPHSQETPLMHQEPPRNSIGDLSDDDRLRLMTRHLVRLWTMIQKGRQHLTHRPDEGESASAIETVVEDLLGRTWQILELKERGLVRAHVELIELAHERFDDPDREERVEQSFLVDLDIGDVLADQSFRPFAALARTREKDSTDDLIQVDQAALYPGFLNRRVRWEVGAQKTRPPAPADWAKLHARAMPGVTAALSAFKEQIRNPLAPDEAVLLLRVKEVVQVGSHLALVDHEGSRILCEDLPGAHHSSTACLELAAAQTGASDSLSPPISVLARWWLGLSDGAVRAQPLAMVVGERRIRLGM